MTRAFIPNPGFDEEAAASDDVRQGLAEVAQGIATDADQMARDVGAPWMPRPGHDLMEVEDDGTDVWVVNTDYAGHLQEYGSVNNDVHAPLRRAAMARGLDISEPI